MGLQMHEEPGCAVNVSNLGGGLGRVDRKAEQEDDLTARAGTGLLESESHRGEEEGANTTRRRESWKNDEICKGQGAGVASHVPKFRPHVFQRGVGDFVRLQSGAHKDEVSLEAGGKDRRPPKPHRQLLSRFYPVPAGSGSLRSPPTEIARHCQYSHRGLGNFDKVFLSPPFGCLQHGNVFHHGCIFSNPYFAGKLVSLGRERPQGTEGGWGPGGE